jgi:hypothetical protein
MAATISRPPGPSRPALRSCRMTRGCTRAGGAEHLAEQPWSPAMSTKPECQRSTSRHSCASGSCSQRGMLRRGPVDAEHPLRRRVAQRGVDDCADQLALEPCSARVDHLVTTGLPPTTMTASRLDPPLEGPGSRLPQKVPPSSSMTYSSPGSASYYSLMASGSPDALQCARSPSVSMRNGLRPSPPHGGRRPPAQGPLRRLPVASGSWIGARADGRFPGGLRR